MPVNFINLDIMHIKDLFVGALSHIACPLTTENNPQNVPHDIGPP